jgi:hypothetical protein
MERPIIILSLHSIATDKTVFGGKIKDIVRYVTFMLWERDVDTKFYLLRTWSERY